MRARDFVRAVIIGTLVGFLILLSALVGTLFAAPKPRLNASVFPQLALHDPAIGGAFVDIRFRVTGDGGEEWYCPAFRVAWPDGTQSFQESDCPPYETRDPEAYPPSWKFNRGFPAGVWGVKGCIIKGGKTLACEVATVRVVGGE